MLSQRVPSPRRAAREVHARYAHGQPRPLGGYLLALGGYGGFAAALTALASRRPEPRSDVLDQALLGVATHKLSRMLAKDPITSPLRAPFTRYEGPAGDAELHESVRRDGAGHATGELVTCPFCLSVWVATALTAGRSLAPRFTRAVCAVLTATATSDALQLGYDRLKQVATG